MLFLGVFVAMSSASPLENRIYHAFNAETFGVIIGVVGIALIVLGIFILKSD
jgi:hypothetical protein